MSDRPWCRGSRRAIPGHYPYHRATEMATCPECGARLKLERGCVPKHHRHGCLIAGCDEPQTGGGLCKEHGREIVGVS